MHTLPGSEKRCTDGQLTLNFCHPPLPGAVERERQIDRQTDREREKERERESEREREIVRETETETESKGRHKQRQRARARVGTLTSSSVGGCLNSNSFQQVSQQVQTVLSK